MPRGLRWLNVLAQAVTLLSAAAVLVSNLVDPGYRRAYGDSVVLVAGYAALQAWLLVVFAQERPRLPLAALAKGVASWLFVGPLLVALTAPEQLVAWPRVAILASVARDWMRVSPARYVYQLFDWGPDVQIGLLGFVFLGRGAFTTVTAFMATRPWWGPLRVQQPVLGRLVTAIPVALVVTAVWGFLASVRAHTRTWSADAHEVARMVVAGIDCATIRAREGQSSTDVRQRGDRTYDVAISYGCRDTRVVARAQDGRVGIAGGPRPECCADGA
jgi:hypothetical protein